jgi:drug/metabolite transporter (DMT)-like permease
MAQKSSKLWLLVPAAALCFSLAGPATKIAVGTLDPLLVVTYRCALAVAALLLILRGDFFRCLKAFSPAVRWWAFAGGVLFGLHLAGFVAGVKYTTFVSAMALLALEPIGIVLTGWCFFKVPPSSLQALGIGIAVLGTVLIGSAGLSSDPSAASQTPLRWLGDLFMLGSVLVYNGYYAVNRRLKADLEQSKIPLTSLVVNFSLAAILYFAGSLTTAVIALFGTSPRNLGADLTTWLALLILGIVPTLGGHTLYQIATRRLSPSWVAMVSPGETVGSIAIGLFLFSTWPTLNETLGGAAILAGATLVGVGEVRLSRRQKLQRIAVTDGSAV